MTQNKYDKLVELAERVKNNNGRVSYELWDLNQIGVSWDDYHKALSDLTAVKQLEQQLLPKGWFKEVRTNSHYTMASIFENNLLVNSIHSVASAHTEEAARLSALLLALAGMEKE